MDYVALDTYITVNSNYTNDLTYNQLLYNMTSSLAFISSWRANLTRLLNKDSPIPLVFSEVGWPARNNALMSPSLSPPDYFPNGTKLEAPCWKEGPWAPNNTAQNIGWWLTADGFAKNRGLLER